MHCVDLGKSFPTSIYLQNLASIQPRTSLVKFAASRDKDAITIAHAQRSLLAGAASGLLEEAAGLGSEAREPVDV